MAKKSCKWIDTTIREICEQRHSSSSDAQSKPVWSIRWSWTFMAHGGV